MGKKYFIPVMVLFVLFTTLLPAQDKKAVSPLESITLDELRDQLYYLASDELEGRGTGDAGYLKAANFAITQFRAAGLKPVCLDADGKKTYLQAVPLSRSTPGEKNLLSVGDRKFIFGSDFVFSSSGGRNGEIPARDMVFVGYGIHEPDSGWDDFKELRLSGAVAVLLNGAPTKGDKPVLSEKLHGEYAGRGGFGKKLASLEKLGVAAVIVIPDSRTLENWERTKNRYTSSRISRPSQVQETGTPVIYAGAALIENLFEGAAYQPLTGEGEYSSFALASQLTVSIDYRKEDFTCYNAVAMLPGTDPEMENEYLTVGAHLDHLGVINGEVYNGANDNASGSVAVIEIAEAVAQKPLRRPVIFILYTGEEKGLLGAYHFVANCPVGMENIVANVNFEMFGRGTPDQEGNALVRVIKDDHFPEMEKIISSVQPSFDDVSLGFMNFFGGSDHYAYYKENIPIICFTVGGGSNRGPSDYHRPEDDVEKFNFEIMLKATRFSYAVVDKVGNMDKLPKAEK